MKSPALLAGPCAEFPRRFHMKSLLKRLVITLSRGISGSQKALLVSSCLLATGCSQEPIVRVQYIETKTYIPIPATLTQPISVDLTNATWGAGIGSLNAALQTCNARLDAIHTLVPPPVKPPINP